MDGRYGEIKEKATAQPVPFGGGGGGYIIPPAVPTLEQGGCYIYRQEVMDEWLFSQALAVVQQYISGRQGEQKGKASWLLRLSAES